MVAPCVDITLDTPRATVSQAVVSFPETLCARLANSMPLSSAITSPLKGRYLVRESAQGMATSVQGARAASFTVRAPVFAQRPWILWSAAACAQLFAWVNYAL